MKSSELKETAVDLAVDAIRVIDKITAITDEAGGVIHSLLNRNAKVQMPLSALEVIASILKRYVVLSIQGEIATTSDIDAALVAANAKSEVRDDSPKDDCDCPICTLRSSMSSGSAEDALRDMPSEIREMMGPLFNAIQSLKEQDTDFPIPPTAAPSTTSKH